MAEPAAYPRLVRPPRGSFFLFGVRGAGKTTWVRETFAEAYIVDLLDESRFQQLAANPALLAPELRTVPRDRLVVLDEVQRSRHCSTRCTVRSTATADASRSSDRAR